MAKKDPPATLTVVMDLIISTEYGTEIGGVPDIPKAYRPCGCSSDSFP